MTGAHEIGHLMLHPEIGDAIEHREIPICGKASDWTRPIYEKEADYFGACFLAPRRQVIEAFRFRFGRPPLHNDDHAGFYIAGNQGRMVATEPAGSLAFAIAVARAGQFGGQRFKPLSEIFGLSAVAMGIRLRELALVAA
jgi:IrrE N-terminal-like domain